MIAYVDCSAGVTVPGLLAALLHLDSVLLPVDQALAAVKLLPVDIHIEEVTFRGILSKRLAFNGPTISAAHAVDVWRKVIESAGLKESVKVAVLSCLTCLSEAQKSLSPGTPSLVTEVSGSQPSTLSLTVRDMAALVGIAAVLNVAHIAQFSASALPLTSGSVQTADGIQSIPAPITLEILRRTRALWMNSSLTGELITPLAAALLATFARFDVPAFVMERVVYGIDASLPEGCAPLRICFGESQTVIPATGADIDWVTVIESHLDTMTGELLGGLMERLLTAGALDVTYTPIQMKKNRPATLLTVICPLKLGEQLSLLLLRETTTLGVRIQQIQRLKAQREQISIETPLGAMLVKVKRLGEQVVSVAPEYEECQRIAKAHALPLADVYEAARAAIRMVYNRE
ncbi:LarC family nickel insertion protein [Dictyobacter arantiisoli]|uniref:UPF0272 protein n=1 Tax=Dictyobacter arantiisoli TaxID=2014874 RepID=A0A5A5TCH0_9CHLR|nr:LarC family nickel insertion protein [Dictyobacter arantiisoli]GCF08846.1 UPF0272 protein [Dictyobacter arantiisoli]